MRFLIFLLTVLALSASSALARPAAGPEPVIVVTLLGTGAPPPLAERFGPATLVQAGGQTLLFDAGRGAEIRLWQVGVSGRALTATFLTHLHSDHLVGLPDVWLTGWVRGPHGGRQTPFRLVGPSGTVAFAANLERAFEADLGFRLAQGLPPGGARIAAEEFAGDGVVHDVDGLRVTAFRVDHGPWAPDAYGYRIDYHGRSVVISGDTRPSDNLIRQATDVDLLVHEVAFARPEAEAAAAVILDNHTRPAEAARIFAAARPGMAAYSHIVQPALGGFAPADLADLTAQTRALYDGPLTVGEDLMVFEIAADGAIRVRSPQP